MIKRLLNTRSAVSTALALAVAAAGLGAQATPAAAQSDPSAAWTQLGGQGPSARAGASLAYDSFRGRSVLFGGLDGVNYQGDTWELDDAGWHQIQVPGPAPRYLAPAAFDSGRNVTVIFGGASQLGWVADTWEWNGSTWSRNFTAHTPPLHAWSSLAYDSHRHVVVLFGGSGSDGSLLNDTWEYDGNDWTQVATAHTPSARRGVSLAFDPIRGKTVLFGGDSSVAMNDTWEYDGTDWTQVPLSVAPPRRQWAASAYDAALGGTVVFGGYQAGATLNDTWLYDGSSWQQISSPNTLTSRFWSAAAFDSARSRVVLFGGTLDAGPNNVFGDTWSLAGANTLPVDWSQAAPVTSPPARVWPAMDYDSARGETVLFGGSTGGNAAFNDTWAWDGFTWTQRATSGAPPALAGAAMVYDSTRRVSVLFGGTDSSGALSSAMWEWNGTAWVQRATPTSPPARTFASMTYDSSRGRIVLFGGSAATGNVGDTWEFDGTTWTQAAPATSPSARKSAATAFDSGRNRTVLFGGSDANGREADTWEWDGSAWDQIQTGTAPYARFWASMAFDPVRGRTVLFGGDHTQPFALGPTNDTWDWDGSSWSRDWTGSAPAVRAGQTMAYDSRRDRAVVFGGFNAAISPNVLYGDTWELASGTIAPAGSPAAAFTPSSLDFGSVQVGTTSNSGHIFVSSTGTGPLSFTTSTTGDFAISSTDCPSAPNPLAAGSSCVVFLTFTPTASGDRSGTLNLTGNMAGGSQSAGLHGVGLAQDFTIAANPTSLSMIQGGPNPTSTISTTVIGNPGMVALSAQSTNAGISASFNPASIPAGSTSMMTVIVGPSVAPGFYGVRVFGTEGTISHYVDVTLQVLPVPDFTIAATPSSVTMAQGGSTIVNISTTEIGSGNAINLVATVSPSGPTATLASPWVPAGSSTVLTVSAGYGVAPGGYTVTVTGTEGSNTHSTTVALTVTLKGIVNGGFESGDFTGWTSSGVTSVVTSPHTGSYAGQVGSTSPSGTSTMSQTFTVPSSGGKLSFYYDMSCSGKVKNDWFTVTVQDGVTGATSTVLAPVCGKFGTWVKVTVNLSSHAGHFVTVTFTNHDDGVASTPTFTLIDDITLS